MRADILIVGQGWAGTLLAWEFERAGISFTIVDQGNAQAASRAAAGILNPITGRRLVKTWRAETLFPAARAVYRELEAALGVSLWKEMRVRRLFADDRERRVAREKFGGGEWGDFVRCAPDDEGLWVEGAARLDVAALLDAARARWMAMNRCESRRVTDLARATAGHHLVIDCRGVATAREGDFTFVPWEFSKGQILSIATDGLDPDVILNRGQWVLPVGRREAWTGATHEPGVTDAEPTMAGRDQLEQRARKILGEQTFVVTGQSSGVRVNLPDKRPVAGRHPDRLDIGLVNGLGAKGALWAPMLARQWTNHLTEGVPFDREVDVGRFSGAGK
jgi:glycine oxidase